MRRGCVWKGWEGDCGKERKRCGSGRERGVCVSKGMGRDVQEGRRSGVKGGDSKGSVGEDAEGLCGRG